MATPQIPGGTCGHCRAPVIDLFAEWTDEYQTSGGKQAILAGAVVLVETTNAKLRLFRVPDLLTAAFILGTLALLSTFLFQ